MLSRLMSMNPIGIVLLLLGVAIMLAGKIIPEKAKIPAQGIITVPEPKIGKASTNAMPNCNN